MLLTETGHKEYPQLVSHLEAEIRHHHLLLFEKFLAEAAASLGPP